ncbi:hypothetical protein IAQ61_002320 [Plenodomus lingam]|uniref:uncharacterized protein n=1 Tax=Leptosphaeria maculans TaxID=5022 RepID=UPI0033219A32|nr:hypothetical protein IAQ61_002320 [Plenodomus lingam]
MTPNARRGRTQQARRLRDECNDGHRRWLLDGERFEWLSGGVAVSQVKRLSWPVAACEGTIKSVDPSLGGSGRLQGQLLACEG